MERKNKRKEVTHPHFVAVRLTDAEMALLDQGASMLGISRSEYSHCFSFKFHVLILSYLSVYEMFQCKISYHFIFLTSSSRFRFVLFGTVSTHANLVISEITAQRCGGIHESL